MEAGGGLRKAGRRKARVQRWGALLLLLLHTPCCQLGLRAWAPLPACTPGLADPPFALPPPTPAHHRHHRTPHARRPQDDYRFGLLWEWTLYDAMLYSPWVAARLQVRLCVCVWGGG